MAMSKQERIAHGAQLKAEARARKLHVIAERRAKAAKLDKAEYIRQIVKGVYRPITAEDLAAEPDPGQEVALV
jgi:hypothetical protein